MVSIEYVIWMPVFLAILALFTDATALIVKQFDMANLSHQIAREASFDVYIVRDNDDDDDDDNAAQRSGDTIADGDYEYQLDEYEVDLDKNGEEVSVTVSISFDDADVFGILAPFATGDLSATTSMVVQRIVAEEDD